MQKNEMLAYADKLRDDGDFNSAAQFYFRVLKKFGFDENIATQQFVAYHHAGESLKAVWSLIFYISYGFSVEKLIFLLSRYASINIPKNFINDLFGQLFGKTSFENILKILELYRGENFNLIVTYEDILRKDIENKKLSYKELLNISDGNFSFDKAFRNDIFNVYDTEIKFNYNIAKEEIFNIFAFWDQPIPPTEVLDAVSSWKNISSENSLYDDESAKKLISNNFDKIVLQAYEKCYHPAMKSDLFRLCRLYANGGLYIDADEKMVGYAGHLFNLMNKMKLKILFVVDEYPKIALINNKAFCAVSNCNLILNIINKIVNNIFSSKEDKKNIPFITGPHAVTKILKEEILKNPDILDEIGFISLVAFNRVFKTVHMHYKNSNKYWRNK
ncbi:MAG: hypothetical protein LBI78_07640 [Campylobacteraceae bacterium]|jgi:hypothetical protein|nr:hypothetical protein [Campylobacteraceae bacterium]